ncbi:hypothetical protein BD769DRAFT_1674633 [Suillus cothurnatus]|nr:hypothetical protein BD769DRAFT_1674633 [Suillus cothurnatus]
MYYSRIAGPYLLPSFDQKPRNVAEKINTGYKTWEFQLYMFGLGPALFYNVLPQQYWANYCRLVRGFRLMCQHATTTQDLQQANVLLCAWEREFELIYYRLREDRLHFVRPCVHQTNHLIAETIQKGSPVCYAQWTMERTIGNLGQEIRQPLRRSFDMISLASLLAAGDLILTAGLSFVLRTLIINRIHIGEDTPPPPYLLVFLCHYQRTPARIQLHTTFESATAPTGRIHATYAGESANAGLARTLQDFAAWLDSPDGRRANRGKVPYLEDENGDPLTDTLIKAIRKLLRGAWAELIRRKLAPKTWADPICEHVLLSPSPSLTPSRASSPNLPLAPLSPTILPLKSLNLLDAASPKLPDTAASPKSVQNLPIVTEKQSIPLPVPSITVAVPMEKENIPPLPVAAPSITLIAPQPVIKINMTSPLSTLALPAVGTMIPPLPPSIDPPPSFSAPCSTGIKGPGKAGDAANGRGSKISKGKMRPTQTKNGRNLCAHRWLKQVESNKTTEEFCVYYGDLSADQRKQYDTEAAELVANNAWDKKVYEGTLH